MLKRRVRSILVALMALVALAVGIFAAVKVGKIEKTKDLGLTSYSVGSIAEASGAEEKSAHAIRTGFLKADKFNKITLGENAEITYRVFYYNADKDFIGKTEVQSADLTEIAKTQTVEEATENVKYFRVVIIVPEAKDDVTVFNMNDYVKQLTVTLNK